MALTKLTTLLLASAASSSALVVEKRATCSSYTLVDTRGTLEPQGDSLGFQTMNKNILAQVPGGKIVNIPSALYCDWDLADQTVTQYDTVYPAGADQNSTLGTEDIVNHVTTTLAANPGECFILEGYSQGAAATVNALTSLTGAAFDAVKGVFLIGDPFHTAGLPCNVDNNGGDTTLNVNGISQYESSGIPTSWFSKTLDVCIYGDGVCDTTHGFGINLQHLEYPSDAPTQNLGTSFVTGRLQATS